MKAILASLQKGNLDRGLLTSNCNFYFTDEAIADYRTTLEKIFSAPGAPGVVVYNAALPDPGQILDTTVERLRTAYDVDVLGAVIAAQVARPVLRAAGGGTLLATSGGFALATVGQKAAEQPTGEPAVSVRRSVFADHLVCLDCGKQFSTLKRHLRTDHQMTPDQYRQKWGLPSSYPVVSPNYAEVRSALAKKNGVL